MTLSSGTCLGPYEIIAALGAGGMGEVYRGHDTRLERDVAVKILPPEFSSNPDRLSRFEQEARAASALNHPNIVTIYDICALDSGSYIAMEYVDGKTLREMISSGPLPVSQSNPYCEKIYMLPIAGGEAKLLAGIDPGERVIQWSHDTSSVLVTKPQQLPAKNL